MTDLLSHTSIRGPLPRSIKPTNEAPAPGAGWTLVAERGINQLHISEFESDTDLAVTLTDEAGQGQSGSKKVCTLPEGAILLAGGLIDGTLELLDPFIATAVLETALATAAVSGGAALAAGEKNLLTATAAAAVDNIATFAIGGTITTPFQDGRATAVDVYLNFRVADDALHATTAGNKLNAKVVLVWMPLANE